MANNVTALRLARDYFNTVDIVTRDEASKRAINLARFGVFTARELALITGASGTVAKALTNNLKALKTSKQVNIKTLDSLLILTVDYQNHKLNPQLLRNLLTWGNTLVNISRVTGIPVDTLREEAYK